MKKENQEKVLSILKTDRYVVDTENGVIYWLKGGKEKKVLVSFPTSSGFHQVKLKDMVRAYMHDIIWLSAHGGFKGRIRHKDGDKGNNRLDNLWLDADVEIPKYEVRLVGVNEFDDIVKLWGGPVKMSKSAIARRLGLRVGKVCDVINKLEKLKNIDI